MRDVELHTQKHPQQKHVNDCDVKNDAYTTIWLIDNILNEHKEKLPQDIINTKCKKYMTLHKTWEENLSFVTCLMQLHMSYAIEKCHMQHV
jgi:hypothetical protein